MAKGGRRGHLPPPPRGPRLSPDQIHIGGAKAQSTGSKEAKSYLHAGRIIHVDTETMVCSVSLDSMRGERHDVPLPAAAGGGPRSWAGVIPEPGTKVIIGWKRFDQRNAFVPYIVEFLTSGVFSAHEYEPFSSVDPADAAQAIADLPELEDDPHANLGVIRLKARKGYPGDFIASAAPGADFILDRDAFLTNRAGNEFRLRDSDQTAYMNTRNEFVSNSAGYYRRGLIRRSAFNFLPDLFPIDPLTGKPATVISPGDPANGLDDNGDPVDRNPAYDVLHDFGLINDDGSRNFIYDPVNAPHYPHVVHPDGQRISYITQGSASFGFNDTPVGYVEDRFEMRMVDDGVMKVTEDGDGFQIDPPYPVFIEDVHGTYVGNDFHTDAGRQLYGRILGMRLFKDASQKQLADGPTLEAVDTVTRLHEIDYAGLARLYAIRNPDPENANQYVFGVTKEGRVMLHVPKTKTGDSDDVGRSIDLNILGMIKAVIGAAAGSTHENKSLDLRLLGGVELDIGRFSSSADPSVTQGGESVRLRLKGGITKFHDADPNTGIAQSNVTNGSVLDNINGTLLQTVSGSIIHESGSELVSKGQKLTQNVGPGGYSLSCSGDRAETVLGKTQAQYAQICNISYALGKINLILAGVDTTTMLAGAITRTLVAGAGITDTVAAGNYAATVATGNFAATVATGTWSATCGAGAMALTAGGGPMTLTSSLLMSITAGTIFNVLSPISKIGASIAGFAVAGIPGPPGPHLDYLTGIPILGVPTFTIG